MDIHKRFIVSVLKVRKIIGVRGGSQYIIFGCLFQFGTACCIGIFYVIHRGATLCLAKAYRYRQVQVVVGYAANQFVPVFGQVAVFVVGVFPGGGVGGYRGIARKAIGKAAGFGTRGIIPDANQLVAQIFVGKVVYIGSAEKLKLPDISTEPPSKKNLYNR